MLARTPSVSRRKPEHRERIRIESRHRRPARRRGPARMPRRSASASTLRSRERHAGRQPVGDPAGQREPAPANRERRQQRMIEAAEAHADDEQHRQRRVRRATSSMSCRASSGTSAPPAPSTTIASARCAQRAGRADDRAEVDRRARLARGEVRRDRRRRTRTDCDRRAARRRCPPPRARATSALSRVAGSNPAATGFMPTARTAGARQARAAAPIATRGLADAGVGAGDEDAARTASRQVAAGPLQPDDRVAFRRRAAARPSTHGRRRPRTSPECARPRAAPRARAIARDQRARPVRPARPSARRVRRADRLELAQQRAAARRTSASTCSMSMTGSAKPAWTSMSPMSCMSTKRLVCVRPSTPRERRAQLAQRIGPERRERQQAADLQHAAELGERARQVVDPLQRQVAPDEVERDAAQRQRVDVGAHEAPAPAPLRARTGAAAGAAACAARARAGVRRPPSAARCRARTRARRDSATPSSPTASPVPQPASRIAAGASFT